MDKEYEYRQNMISDGFQKMPDKADNIRINVIGEIVEARNFESDDLYIIYELFCPKHFQLDYEDLLEFNEYPEEDVLEDWNKVSSVTQTSTSIVERGEEGEKSLVAYFSFPLDFQFQVQKDDADSKKYPLLFLQVNSMDSWGRTRIEGYGFLEIPKVPGYHEIQVQTYAPQPSLYQKIHEFFLGGIQKIKDYKKIAETTFKNDQDIEGFVNHFNLKSESKGFVKLNLNVVYQSKQYQEQCIKEAQLRIQEEKKYKYLQQKKMFQAPQLDPLQDTLEINAKARSLMQTDSQYIQRYQVSQLNNQNKF